MEQSPESTAGEDSSTSSSKASPTCTKPHSPIAKLLERTGYSIMRQSGLRRYGPSPSWEGSPPPRGCEVFVGNIPRDCFEDELVPVFEKAGQIFELALLMDSSAGLNRGFAFVVYCTPSEAKESVKVLNNYEIRKRRTLDVRMSVNNCRLYVGGLPKRVTKEDIKAEMQKVTEGVVDVIVYLTASDKSRNKGFSFVEYESHRSAAMARQKVRKNHIQLWGHHVRVDWAVPELEVDEEIMAQVKDVHVRNLMLSTTEAQIEEAFSAHVAVEQVRKIRDYAFVHFHTKEDARSAKETMNGAFLNGAQIEVTLAKPVVKRPFHYLQKQLPVPTLGFVQVDQYGTVLPVLHPPPPKYMMRNSMGVCTMVRARNTRGCGGGFYPLYPSPQTYRGASFGVSSIRPTPHSPFAMPQGPNPHIPCTNPTVPFSSSSGVLTPR